MTFHIDFAFRGCSSGLDGLVFTPFKSEELAGLQKSASQEREICPGD
jgi:hypothetical protein